VITATPAWAKVSDSELNDDPYLSVVVVTRNDDHGGNPLTRLQAFVNTFDAQCKRTGLDVEVVVVEWNPPSDRPRVSDLLQCPADCAFPVRFVEVPPDLHGRIEHADVLPLFQMIGKNVGVRRARGKFVLCTNIDIIFSNELVEFLAARQLRAGVLYDTDRHDIQPSYPVQASLEVQMAYCRENHIRVNGRYGTYPTDRFGRAVALTPDVFEGPSVTMGEGWHTREGEERTGFFRWAQESAGLDVALPSEGGSQPSMLRLEIEPNPYDASSWVNLLVSDAEGTLARFRLSERRTVHVPLRAPAGMRSSIALRAVDASRSSELPGYERREHMLYRLYSARVVAPPAEETGLFEFDSNKWQLSNASPALIVKAEGAAISVQSAPEPYTNCLKYGNLRAPVDGAYTFAVECSCSEGNLSLEAYDDWNQRWLTSERHEIARGDRRWLFVRVSLRSAQAFSLYITNFRAKAPGVSRFSIHRLCGSRALSDFQSRIGLRTLTRALRAKAARRSRAFAASVLVGLRRSRVGSWLRRLAGVPPVTVPAIDVPAVAAVDEVDVFLRKHRPASVRQNACGDFQLMSRTDWFELRGYPEFHMFSMNIDGLFADVARGAGITEQSLDMPCCIYHLEHEKGSGWTPEGEALLRKRIAESGVTWLEWRTIVLWAGFMTWSKRPMIFNGSNWGFGDVTLPERTVKAAPAGA
jgi:hypothetical protein